MEKNNKAMYKVTLKTEDDNNFNIYFQFITVFLEPDKHSSALILCGDVLKIYPGK